MSQVVKDPKSDKKISVTLKAEQKRHSELPVPQQVRKKVVKGGEGIRFCF